MLTKFNDSNDMNTLASDTIHSYIKDGYRIDAKESVIDREKDKNCTFKAALVKDVDGVVCKAVITLTEETCDGCRSLMYHKVDYVDDLKWSEESRGFSTLCKQPDTKEESIKRVEEAASKLNDCIKQTKKSDPNKTIEKLLSSKNLDEATKSLSLEELNDAEDYLVKLVRKMLW